MTKDLEYVARQIMGWIGSQPLNGPYPWDIGVAPETATLDASGKPHGGENETFFSLHDDGMWVYGPKNRHGSSGPAFWFNPFTDARSAQMVLTRLGYPGAIFNALRVRLEAAPFDSLH